MGYVILIWIMMEKILYMINKIYILILNMFNFKTYENTKMPTLISKLLVLAFTIVKLTEKKYKEALIYCFIGTIYTFFINFGNEKNGWIKLLIPILLMLIIVIILLVIYRKTERKLKKNIDNEVEESEE